MSGEHRRDRFGQQWHRAHDHADRYPPAVTPHDPDDFLPQLADWRERSQCPQNDRLCGEAVWLGQTMLLGPRRDMDQIAEAARKVSAHAARLAKA